MAVGNNRHIAKFFFKDTFKVSGTYMLVVDVYLCDDGKAYSVLIDGEFWRFFHCKRENLLREIIITLNPLPFEERFLLYRIYDEVDDGEVSES